MHIFGYQHSVCGLSCHHYSTIRGLYRPRQMKWLSRFWKVSNFFGKIGKYQMMFTKNSQTFKLENS